MSLSPSSPLAPAGGSVIAAALRRRFPAPGLLLIGALVAALVLLPLAFLILQASQVGWATLRPLLFRHLTETLLWNTIRLAFAVTLACAVIGVAVAWCVERTDLPWRRFWATVLVLPLAIPDFVIGYGWISVEPGVQGYWGSVLVMSLGSYPLVYLPVAAALRSADRSLEDVARGLGLGRIRTFASVTLHQIRPALLGGSMLVALILLAEFGTFEILRFQTFTTEIYTEYQIGYSATAGCALSLVLVLLGLFVLAGEAAARGRAGRRAAGPQQPAGAADEARPGDDPGRPRAYRTARPRDRRAAVRARPLVRPGHILDAAVGLDRPCRCRHRALQRARRRARHDRRAPDRDRRRAPSQPARARDRAFDLPRPGAARES